MSGLYRLFPAALVIIICFAGSAHAAEDGYYTWVDEKGVRNYSELDPKNQNATFVTRATPRFGYQKQPEPGPEQTIQQRNPPTGSSAGTTTPGDDSQMQAERDQVQQAIAKVKQSNCEVGRRNLAKLEAYARIRVMENDGTERVLSDEEKQAKIDSAKKTISDNCTSS